MTGRRRPVPGSAAIGLSALFAAAVLVASVPPAFGQSNITGSARLQEQGRGQGQQQQEQQQAGQGAQEAQIGAGTTSESTTGSSGYAGPPQPGFSSQAGTTGAQGGPPALSQLCDDVTEPEVRQHCIEKAEQ